LADGHLRQIGGKDTIHEQPLILQPLGLVSHQKSLRRETEASSPTYSDLTVV
jgi:hypothetical protein